MMSAVPFYFKLLRRYVILFGAHFDDITVVHTDEDTNELTRFKVPILYGPKDHWVTRLSSDPDVFRELQNILPRMSFEITNITRDAERAQNTLLRVAKGDNASRVSAQYMGAPYNIDFQLTVYAKNIDDGNQIVEQIFPYFNPTYTVTVTPIPDLGFMKDIPITLNGLDQQIIYEGPRDTTRFVYWTLNFTMKGYFFGPITTPKIIRKAIANIFNDPSLVTGYVIKMKLDRGNNGTFQISDTIYQGSNFDTASAYGIVLKWEEGSHRLMIGGAQGNFAINNTIRAVSTNAAYTIASFDARPIKLAEIVVTPNPLTAEPGDDYGYTVRITEFPDTEANTA